MTSLREMNKLYYRTEDATATAADIATGKTAYVNGGKVTGTGVYSPAMMQFDGSTGYYANLSYTSSGNKVTGVMSFKIPSFTGVGAFMYVYRSQSTRERIVVVAWASDYSDTDLANRISVWSRNSANTITCQLHSVAGTYLDDAKHTLFYSYDGDAGAATYIIDGVNADDATNASRVAPAVATMSAGASSLASVGASTAPGQYTNGQIGFCGHRDAYLTNWSDFMQADGTPKELDESTWTEWGAQPLFWNEHGDMVNNLGSAGAMTKNGTINVGKGGNVI